MTLDIGTCERCNCTIERGDLRCAICGLATPEVELSAQTLRVHVLRCQGCGAAVSYDAEHRAPKCAFCGSVMETEELVDPPEQCEAHLEWRVSRAEAADALQRWLGSRGFFRPSDLGKRSRLEKLMPLAWVGWVFSARCFTTWTADSNMGSRRSAWAPHSGEVELDFNELCVSASRGLKDAEVAAIASSYDLRARTTDPEREIDGMPVSIESFDVQRSAARRRIARALEAAAAHRIAKHHVPGVRHRNVHASVLLSHLDTKRLAFPAWVLAYRYDQKLYRVVISGQDASTLVGEAPLSWARVLLVAAAALAFVLIVVLVIVTG